MEGLWQLCRFTHSDAMGARLVKRNSNQGGRREVDKTLIATPNRK